MSSSERPAVRSSSSSDVERPSQGEDIPDTERMVEQGSSEIWDPYRPFHVDGCTTTRTLHRTFVGRSAGPTLRALVDRIPPSLGTPSYLHKRAQ